jgi:hypothetical protein
MAAARRKPEEWEGDCVGFPPSVADLGFGFVCFFFCGLLLLIGELGKRVPIHAVAFPSSRGVVTKM